MVLSTFWLGAAQIAVGITMAVVAFALVAVIFMAVILLAKWIWNSF